LGHEQWNRRTLEAPSNKKRNFSPVQRKAAADRMRKMRAAKKKAAKKEAKAKT
jgi:hypothetical protein